MFTKTVPNFHTMNFKWPTLISLGIAVFVYRTYYFLSHRKWISNPKLDELHGDIWPIGNDDSDKIVETQGELDPDKNYFNQLAHHLSKSKYNHNEESINKYIQRKIVSREDFSIMRIDIRSIPTNPNNFLSFMSNIDHNFSAICFPDIWFTPTNNDAHDIVGYNHAGLTREDRKGGGISYWI